MNSAILLKPFIIFSPDEHTMGTPVLKYLKMKMHHFIFEGKYKNIIVTGKFDRTSNIGKNEKKSKLINLFRPTARIVRETLYIECFPGTEYIRHYASLIASYLELTNKKGNCVSYILPSEDEMHRAVKNLLLNQIPLKKTVITGWGLFEMFPEDIWQENEGFVFWKNEKIGGIWVTLLAFETSFWGDIFGRICKNLVNLGVETIIYTAKAGSINKKLIPNKSIVTGSTSLVEGEIIKWSNIFEGLDYPNLTHVSHLNSPSAVFETQDWYKLMDSLDVVESEIGHGARCISRMGACFSYLHYISNTLSERHSENLSNERDEKIIIKRERIKKQIKHIIIQALSAKNDSKLLPL